MQKLLPRNISDESLGISTISITFSQQTREKHKKHNATCDYTYTGRNQGRYTWALIDIEGSSDTNSCDKKWCQMACAWRHILVMNWLQAVWQKYYSYTHTWDTGGVCGQVLSTQGHFISTVELLGCRRSHKRESGMAVIHCGMCHPHQQKIPKYCLTASSGGFEYETHIVQYCAWYSCVLSCSILWAY